MKQKLLLRVPAKDWQDAFNVAMIYIKYYNTPKWDKKKIIFDKIFTVHETETGTVIVQPK